MRTAGAVLGVLIIAAVWMSVIVTLIIPRGRAGYFKFVDQLFDHAYTVSLSRVTNWDRRDTFRSGQPIVTLGALLFTWLCGFVLGFGLVLWPSGHTTFLGALRQSGSSLFTLGFATSAQAGPTIVDFACAASGLVVVALQIAYLPTLYSAYNRRETDITLLSPRAGIPAWGPELLARMHIANGVNQLTTIYQTWERWSADVAESHASYPSLMRFRSPESHSSWIISQLAVLDAAALHLAACPSSAPYTARLCLQMGFNCLRKLSATLRIPVNEDPRPDDPLQLSWDEFLKGWDRLSDVGFPLERSAEEAWPDFRGWRVNYEHPAYRIAWILDAVPAHWSGPRHAGSQTLGPGWFVNRTPENPEGEHGPPGKKYDKH
jgi:hypothetical protein